jgi:Flp pilus assembly protein CpaB
MQSVLVAGAPLEPGAEVGAQTRLSLRRVPAHFAPPDALSDPADAIGERLQIALPAGAFLTRSLLSSGEQTESRFKLRRAERALTVDVVVSPIGQSLAPGNRIDLYASGFGGDQRTEEIVVGAEVLAVAEGSEPDRARPTIRLAGSQVAAVVRADVFAHELRAVMRN